MSAFLTFNGKTAQFIHEVLSTVHKQALSTRNDLSKHTDFAQLGIKRACLRAGAGE